MIRWHLAWSAVAAMVLAPVASAQVPAPPKQEKHLFREAPYDVLVDNRVEVTNFFPEPFTAMAFEPDGSVWTVNPYGSTLVHVNLAAGVAEAIVPTGHNPVSVAYYDEAPGESDPVVIAVCTGSHAAFVHDAAEGDVLDVIPLDSEPGDIAVDREGHRAFISCQGANTVLEVDLVQRRVTGRFHLPVGERPGPLLLERDDEDNVSVFVAQTVTGNNTTAQFTGGETVGRVMDLSGSPGGELPDHDIYRINPDTGEVVPVVRGAGSLLFDIERNPLSKKLWVLSTDSHNQDFELDNEPELRGRFVTNQLVIAPSVTMSSALIDAPPGIDVDDYDPDVEGAQYDPAQSVNQARTLAFNSDGLAFIASPFSDVLAILRPGGTRLASFQLPEASQCYAVEVYEPDPRIVLALCLGTMTLEVFSTQPFSATPVRSIPIGLDPTPLQLRKGRDVYLDGGISMDGRFSCASCHPRGMSDQLGWSIAGPPLDVKDVMVTQSLLSIVDTYPFHWRGERKLADFSKAFDGLLGAPEHELPDSQEVQDLVAFMRSLQAPANPLQNPRRVVDDSIEPVTPIGIAGSAVRGQRLFQDVPAFLGFTCAECHGLETGSTNNLFAEIASFAPRAAQIETPHLRQLQHRGTRTRFLDMGNGPEEVNINGYGTAHRGQFASLFRFVFESFGDLSFSERNDIFLFVQQWDQGISPAVHRAYMIDEETTAEEFAEINAVLLAGARRDWNDVVLFGSYAPEGTSVPVRLLYEPDDLRFRPDDPALAAVTWAELVGLAQAGDARLAVLGMPPANGRRFALDHDNDGLLNGEERALGTDPWKADTDGDRWEDGHEVEHGDDPIVPQLPSSDTTPPTLVDAQLLFSTARVAKYSVRFSEEASYTVSYQVPGYPGRVFQRGYESVEDTFTLTHNTPSTRGLPPLVYDVRITLRDRGGNNAGPFPLPDFSPTNGLDQEDLPPFLHVGAFTVEQATPVDANTLDVRLKVRVDSNDHAPDFVPTDGQMVFLAVALHDAETGMFVQSRSFTSDLEKGFDIVSLDGVVSTYQATPGPFLVSPLTDFNGETIVEFQQSGLTSGQRVRVAVMGIVEPGVAPPGHDGPVYDLVSLGQMQPLLLEGVSEVEFVMP